jgi:GLPGLI family protein
VSHGPEGYWGLPGLILEVNDGKTVLLCSKVVLNPKVKAEIKAPSKGKVISQKEYDETVMKKMEEFREMNQGRGGRESGMQIRYGN